MAAKDKKVDASVRVETEVVTNTQVVDNTAAPASARVTDYESSSEDLGNGHTRVTYGEPVGGFPADENEDA